VADAVDSAVGCETVALPATPAPAPVPPAPAPRDTVAPTLLLAPLAGQRVGTVLRSGLRILLTCSETCTVRGVARWRGRPAASGTTRALAGLARRLTLRFTGAAKRSLRRVRSARLALTLTATDASGNRRTIARSLTLRR
jgi:hypothetical protein